VAVHWLTEPNYLEEWIRQIAELRQETALFEEVSADVIVNLRGDWNSALVEHGVPRLLVQTRSILNRMGADEVAAWRSGAQVIADRLQGLTQMIEQFSPEIAKEWQSLLSAPKDKRKARTLSSPLDLNHFAVENFRNIERLSLLLRPDDTPVYANVVQGPNGSGKSSLSEAMAIGIGHVSTRYIEYIADHNEPAPDKARKYMADYLRPIGRDATPRAAININALQPLQLADPENAADECELISGTFLSQSASENLLKMQAADLGAQIAGSYSGTAATLLDHVDKRIHETDAKRTQFNRQWGFRANVSKIDTARAKIATTFLSNATPEFNEVWAWINEGARLHWNLGSVFRQVQSKIDNDWRSNESKRERSLINVTSEIELRRILRDALASYYSCLKSAALLVSSVKDISNSISPDFGEQLELWENWLREVSPSEPSTAPELRGQLEQLRAELARLARGGTVLRERLDHLTSVEVWARKHWSEQHSATCPTCDTDLANRGGLLGAMAGVRSITEAEVNRLRGLYLKTRSRIDELSRTTPMLSPPLTPDAQATLTKDVALLSDIRLAKLTMPGEFEQLRAVDAFINKRKPSIDEAPSDGDIKDKATKLATQIWAAFREFEEITEAPDAWKRTQKLMVQELTAGIREHLPQSVQALWWELARNMLPAPWQYPGAINFSVEQKRAQTEIRVVVRGKLHSPLAAHILNAAEIHNLGLAWFLTRYLTHGRFHYTFMVLDDPAHQMDQPTFRELCRLLGSLMRLHRSRGLPLTLVLFLHQDERALEAGRALDATVHLLRWQKGAASITRHLRMRSPPIAPRTPYRIVESA
jgi:hypothetical protein